MLKPMRGLLLSVLALGTFTACSHTNSDSEPTPSKPSVTDEARSRPVPPPPPKAEARVAPVPSRTDAEAARTRAAVAAAPKEGTDEEYAADVDAAMGDQESSTAFRDSSVAVNSQPDNTRVNRLKNGEVGLSADQQGNSETDIEITRKIRKSITDKKELSTYAHNVKIITREGRVVLQGPVRTEAERKIIEDEAVRVAGSGNVSSGIEIRAK